MKTNLIPIFIGRSKLTIPKRTRKLLYVSDRNPQDISSPYFQSIDSFDRKRKKTRELPIDEPSTILIKIPIRKPRNISKVPRPDYYPAYIEFTSEQKWIYLNWLQDLSKPIYIGYVFLYYCGLERHLLAGEFDLAVDEILYLRRYHHNHSFTYYSNNALLISCISKKRLDRLKDIIPELELGYLNNVYLLAACDNGYTLRARQLIGISENIKSINQRYIKREPALFETTLNKNLIAKYGKSDLPFSSRYNTSDLPEVQEVLFANVSLPSELRAPEIPSFFSYKPFVDEIESLFRMTHEEVKVILRERRRSRR